MLRVGSCALVNPSYPKKCSVTIQANRIVEYKASRSKFGTALRSLIVFENFNPVELVKITSLIVQVNYGDRVGKVVLSEGDAVTWEGWR
jgi:hypothetical protein